KRQAAWETSDRAARRLRLRRARRTRGGRGLTTRDRLACRSRDGPTELVQAFPTQMPTGVTVSDDGRIFVCYPRCQARLSSLGGPKPTHGDRSGSVCRVATTRWPASQVAVTVAPSTSSAGSGKLIHTR